MSQREHLRFMQQQLSRHPMYEKLDDLTSVRIFMQNHVFAVWDFMSLLKSLQNRLTCVSLPWRPSPYPANVVRLVNEIVLGEESDVDPTGQPTSHFALYLAAMREVGADVGPVVSYVETFPHVALPPLVAPFVEFNLDLAQHGQTHEIAAAFFFGREKLIPAMFEQIVAVLQANRLECPTLLYYLERHIALDGDEHGPMAERCLDALCTTSDQCEEAMAMGIRALQLRSELWDRVAVEIDRRHDQVAA